MTGATLSRSPGSGTTADLAARRPIDGPRIESLRVSVYTIPTDAPESDGTLAWDRTTMIVVEPEAGGMTGLGYSYADAAVGRLIADNLRPIVLGRGSFELAAIWASLVGSIRNIGRQGIAATAISAVDNALWDLKARLLGVSLVDLLGSARASIPAYGSGGFCSYGDARLASQLGGWANEGFRFVKMKIGREPGRDPARVDIARTAIGDDVELFVDANGAFDRSRALATAAAMADRRVTWFEEPVSSDDVEGLRFLCDRAPDGMAIAAGEYGWDQFHFRRLLEARAVDVLQADATRCLGITGFQMAAALCEAFNVPLSSHCAPALHVALTCAARPAVHLEWFHDHVRIEQMLFDGAPLARTGAVSPDRGRPGLGLELKTADAAPYLEWASS